MVEWENLALYLFEWKVLLDDNSWKMMLLGTLNYGFL